MLEAADIEGAGDYRILWQIVVPVSLPILATITLLCMVGHWEQLVRRIPVHGSRGTGLCRRISTT